MKAAYSFETSVSPTTLQGVKPKYYNLYIHWMFHDFKLLPNETICEVQSVKFTQNYFTKWQGLLNIVYSSLAPYKLKQW